NTLLVEWAPATLPHGPTFPYRRRYALHDDGGIEAGVRRRLQHIGVSQSISLHDQIRAFQRAYGLPVDGRNESVAGPLFAFHDTAALPPLPESPLEGALAPFSLTPDLRPP